MSSIESRENNGRTSFRVRYRHEGHNRAVTFVTEKRAQEWRGLLDEFGHDLAAAAIPSSRPDLSDFAGTIIPVGSSRIDPFGTFVYMLWADDKKRPVYVGATTNLPKRIWDHIREKLGLWTTYSVIRCKDAETMWRVEARLIGHYRPELNTMNGHGK